MADPVTTPPATPAPTPAPAATPVEAASPQQTPLPPAGEQSKSAAAAPVAPPLTQEPTKPAVDAKPAEPPPAEPAAAVPTLLEDFDKQKADADAAKAKPAAETKPADAAKPAETPPAILDPQSKPAAPQPVEYKYTVPETIKMDDAIKGEVHKAFDDFRANPAEGAQALINLHDKQMKAYAQYVAEAQQQAFKDTRQQWRKDILSDQELGGSGHQTAMGAVARMRDLLVPEKHRAAFEQFLRVTGAGDHPEFLRILHQAARLYDEPPVPSVNPRPPPNNGQRPSRRLRDIYDHPRSSADGRS